MRRAGLLVLFVMLVAWVAAGNAWAVLGKAGDLDIAVINVGNGAADAYGDSILIELPGKQLILVDCGSGLGTNVLRDALTQLMALPDMSQTFEALIVTHWHEDHHGGLPALLGQHPLHFKRIYHSGVFRTGAMGVNQIGDRAETGLPKWLLDPLHEVIGSTSYGLQYVHRLKRKDCLSGLMGDFDWQGVTATVLHPSVTNDFGAYKNFNSSSVVLKLDWEPFGALLTGDLDHNGELQAWPETASLEAEFLKVPHHGSNGNTLQFLEAVQPVAAIFPCPPPPFTAPDNARLQKAIEKADDGRPGNLHPYRKCAQTIVKCLRKADYAQGGNQVLAVGARRKMTGGMTTTVSAAKQAEVPYLRTTLYTCYSPGNGMMKVSTDPQIKPGTVLIRHKVRQ